MDINWDGTIIAAGAPREWHWDPNDDTKTDFNRGAVYIFRYNGTSWVSEQRIIPLDWNCKDYSSLNPRPLQGNPWTIPLLFGLSVDLDPEGDTIAVGAPHWDVPDPTDTQWSCPDDPQRADLNHYNYGAVYTFKYLSGSWNQTAKFWHDSGVYPSSLNVFFGRHVVVEDDLLVVQSPTIDRTWFFQENPITQAWSLVYEPVTSEKTRHSKSIDIRRTAGADWVVLGASKFTNPNPEGSESGKLFLYKKPTGGVWALNATFLPSSQPLAANDHFGAAVAISFVNGRIVASAPDKELGTIEDQGRVYVIHGLGN